MSSSTTTVLITGANKGLGLALAATYLSRPSHTVIASVRTASTASSLTALPKDSTSKLIVVHIDNADPPTPGSAVAKLKAEHGITSLDLVHANAAIATVMPLASEALLSDVEEHFKINVLGPLALFQATLPLLKASKKPNGEPPRFIAMSSVAGSIGGQELAPVPNSAYGTSKAALNYIVRKMHFENEDIVATAMHPGWVQTDMGNRGAEFFGLEKAEITVEESITGIVKVVDGANRENAGGKYLVYNGETLPW